MLPSPTSAALRSPLSDLGIEGEIEGEIEREIERETERETEGEIESEIEGESPSFTALAGAPEYRDSAEHLRDHLERLSWSVDRLEVLRFAAEHGELGPGHLAQLEALERAIVERDRVIAAREARTRQAGRALPLCALIERFGLGPADVHLLLAAALPALDVALARRASALWSSASEYAVHELVELLAFDDHDQAVVLAVTEARAPLVRHRLVRALAARGYLGETPVAQRRLSVPERVVAFLRGDDEFRAELFRHVAYEVAPAPDEDSPASLTLRRMLATGERPLVVVGPALIGKLHAVSAAAAGLGRRVLAVELEALAAAPDPEGVWADLLRERRLLDAVLVARAGELSILPPGLWRELAAAAEAGEVIVSARDSGGLQRRLRAPRVVRVGLPSHDEQVRLWRASLAPHGGAAALPSTAASLSALASLARRYPLGPGDVRAAVEAAAATASVERRALDAADLVAAARARVQHQLGEVAELVSTPLSWEDLVLRDEVVQRILEVVAAVRFREQVLGRWGFAAKMPYGRSVTALFSGPPGTGKTMVATLIAKELGLELFRIDLSKVVSKWIGETEKNLGKVFDQAQASGAVLLFDEADSLFAKRTEVKSSNDRYANLEVNYLLQRLEAYDGIALLTTNHPSSIDPAFLRRIRFRVEFPEPDEREREALWRSMIPAGAPLCAEVDFAALARRFKVSGGHIKNAVIRAAFLAAGSDAAEIDHELLALAAQLEWTELGNLPK